MICYKCKQEMYPAFDTAWRKHKDGTKERTTEFLCADCRVWACVEINDYSECELEEE